MLAGFEEPRPRSGTALPTRRRSPRAQSAPQCAAPPLLMGFYNLAQPLVRCGMVLAMPIHIYIYIYISGGLLPSRNLGDR